MVCFCTVCRLARLCHLKLVICLHRGSRDVYTQPRYERFCRCLAVQLSVKQLCKATVSALACEHSEACSCKMTGCLVEAQNGDKGTGYPTPHEC